jgi:hypothetical protein
MSQTAKRSKLMTDARQGTYQVDFQSLIKVLAENLYAKGEGLQDLVAQADELLDDCHPLPKVADSRAEEHG